MLAFELRDCHLLSGGAMAVTAQLGLREHRVPELAPAVRRRQAIFTEFPEAAEPQKPFILLLDEPQDLHDLLPLLGRGWVSWCIDPKCRSWLHDEPRPWQHWQFGNLDPAETAGLGRRTVEVLLLMYTPYRG